MNEPQNTDGLEPGGLAQARSEDLAGPTAEGELKSPADGAAVDGPRGGGVLLDESVVPARLRRAPVREAPPSERVEYVVAAPAPLVRGTGLVAEGRKKVELRVRPEAAQPVAPGTGEDPDELVVLEAFRKLPSARSRRAKTKIMRRGETPFGKLPGEEESPPEGAGAEPATAAQAGPETTARTVGGRTAKLAASPSDQAAPSGAEGVAAGPSPAEVGEILARTLGGRTERILPNMPAASARGAAEAAFDGVAGEGAIAPAVDPAADPGLSRAPARGARSRARVGAAMAIVVCGVAVLAWFLSASGTRRATPAEAAPASASGADATATAGPTDSAPLPSAAASPSTAGSTEVASTAGAAGAAAAASPTDAITPKASAESTSARAPRRRSTSPGSKPQASGLVAGSSLPLKRESDLLFDNPSKP